MSDSNNQSFQMPPTILFDLDETLHLSEDHLKTPSWNHLLSPWQWIWNPQDYTYPDNFRSVQENQRPETGINPQRFIAHLIEGLGLKLTEINENNLQAAGFQPENIEALMSLKQTHKEQDPATDEMTKILVREWTAFLQNKVKKEGVIAIPGASEMVRRFHRAGYKIGVVTQTPLVYARAVLNSLGLNIKEQKFVDAIVSGKMVTKPKPDPEPLMRANWILGWPTRLAYAQAEKGSSLTKEEKNELATTWWRESITEFRPKAMIGDSPSDVLATVAWGIPSIIIQIQTEPNDLEMFKRLGATLVVVRPDEITPEMFDREPFINFSQTPEGQLPLYPPFRHIERQ